MGNPVGFRWPYKSGFSPCTSMSPQNPLGARVREVQRVPLDTVLSDQLVLPDIAL